jgi:pimeloyl-[acyl-carrier protein] methyl ester esterase
MVSLMHIILLRGLAREAAHWLDFPTELQYALGSDCSLHLIDFPGCGEHHQQPALASVAAMTDHARAHREISSVLAAGKKIIVIGISMGGMVALNWAQRFAAEVNGVVLINSSAGDQPIFWRLQPSALPRILLALLLPAKQREALVLRMVTNQTEDYEQHLQQWLTIQSARPVTRSTIITMLRAAAQFRPQAECTVKGLVLASEMDRMVSARASEDIAKRFNWPLARHPHAGHDLPMDDGAWVAKQIGQWLSNMINPSA